MTPSSSPPIAPRRSSLGRLVEQSTTLLMVSIGSLILVLALLILFHENANATKGYRLRSLEHERSSLLLKEEVLRMEMAQAQALENLQSNKRIKAMIPLRTSRYIKEEETVAASPTAPAVPALY